MKKSKAVIFSPGGVRIVTNPDLSGITCPFLVDPDLSAVRHLPPDRWALVGNQVVPSQGAVRVVLSPVMPPNALPETTPPAPVAPKRSALLVCHAALMVIHLIVLAILIRGY